MFSFLFESDEDELIEHFAGVSIGDEELPETVSGEKFRSLSNTKGRSYDLQGYGWDADEGQERCHRYPNSILKDAYNSTTDAEVKKELLAFGFCTGNVYFGKNNDAHTDMEKALVKNTATGAQIAQKEKMIETAFKNMYDLVREGKMSIKTMEHAIITFAKTSDQCNNIICNMKKSQFPKVKGTIEKCQDMYESDEAVAARDATKAEAKAAKAEVKRKLMKELEEAEKAESSAKAERATQVACAESARSAASQARSVADRESSASNHSYTSYPSHDRSYSSHDRSYPSHDRSYPSYDRSDYSYTGGTGNTGWSTASRSVGGGTVYSGHGRPRDTDYDSNGDIRRR